MSRGVRRGPLWSTWRTQVVVVGVVIVSGGSCYFGDGVDLPCVGDANCPFGLLCVADRCAVDTAAAPPPKAIPVTTLDGADVDDGATPRVLGVDGDVLFASRCGLSRFRNGDDAATVLHDGLGACFEDVDAAVDGFGDVRGVVSGGGVVSGFIVAEDEAVVGAFNDGGGARAFGSVVVDNAGVVHAAWALAPAAGDEGIEDVVVDGVAQPVFFGGIPLRALSNVAPSLDDDGAILHLLLERQSDGRTQLVVRSADGTGAITVTNNVDGATDIVRCGGVNHVAFRRDNALVVATVDAVRATADANAKSDVGLARAVGDVALACDDDDTAWVAVINVDDGSVSFGPRVAQDTFDFVTLDDAGAARGVALAVDAGRAAVAWVTVDGDLRVATPDPL